MARSRRVLTIGTFDLLHHGHLRLFERAADYGPLTVGVNSDRFVREYKGRGPERTERERLHDVRTAGAVTAAVLNDGPGIALIRELRPGLLVVGSDWLDRDYTNQIATDAAELTRLGVAVLFLPRTPGVSSTELRETT